jgi:hypothetical protein
VYQPAKNAIEAAQATLPPLVPPRITGETPWRELEELRTRLVSAVSTALAQEGGSIIVESAPAGVRLNGTPIPDMAPFDLSLQPGLYRIALGTSERELILETARPPSPLLTSVETGNGGPRTTPPNVGNFIPQI